MFRFADVSHGCHGNDVGESGHDGRDGRRNDLSARRTQEETRWRANGAEDTVQELSSTERGVSEHSRVDDALHGLFPKML